MNTKLVAFGIFLALIVVTFISCMNDSITNKNRKRFTPNDWFEGKELPMAQAIYSSNLKEIEHLVKDNQVDINGMSPNGRLRFLLYACILERPEVVEKLLDLGADPNLISPMRQLDGKPESVDTDAPLSFSIWRNNMKITKMLLKAGANPNLPAVASPFSGALTHKKSEGKEYLDLLFEYGADPNFQNSGDGKSILQDALLGRNFWVLSYLLDKKANPLLLDMKGRNFAFSLQEELANYRGTEEGKEKLEAIKQRLESEYHIQFPVKRDYRKGAETFVKRAEALPESIQNMYGMESNRKFEQKIKDSLAVNKTYWGMSIEEIDNLTQTKK